MIPTGLALPHLSGDLERYQYSKFLKGLADNAAIPSIADDDLSYEAVQNLGVAINAGEMSFSEAADDLLRLVLKRIPHDQDIDIAALELQIYQRLADIAAFDDEVADRIEAAVATPRKAKPTAATSTLPAFYPAPLEDRTTAKARQDAAIRAHLDKATRLEVARREADQQRAQAIAAAGGEDALTAGQKAKITKRIHRAIALKHGYGVRLPLPPAVLFSGAQGSGKTTIVRQYIAATSSPAIWWVTEPTIAKASEEYETYVDDPDPSKPPAMLIRGRSRKDPRRPGHLMCDRPATADRVAKAGLSVVKSLCLECPFKDKCGDQRQRREAAEMGDAGRGAVFFMASEYALLPAPVPLPDHAVIDESLLIAAVEARKFPLADIRALAIPNRSVTGINVMETLREVCDSLTAVWPTTPGRVSAGDERTMPRPLAYLRYAGITRKTLRDLSAALSDELDRLMPELSGRMSDSDIGDALDTANVGTLHQALSLVGAVAREIDRNRETLTGVVVREGQVFISRLRKLVGMKHASLTVLDGTGDYQLSQNLYGSRLEYVHVPFPRLAHVIGTKLKGYSRLSITAIGRDGKAIANKEEGAANLRGDLSKIFDRLPTGSMICGTDRTVKSVFSSGAISSGTPCAHFGALRGLNEWEHVPGGLFIGAERISIGDLEDIARAYLADDDEPFISMDEPAPKGWGYKQWPYKATRMRRMRDGSLQPVEVEVHPDPRVQRVHEQIREAELIQAIDRTRSIWKPRQMVLLNDLCLDVTYDAIYRHRDLVAGGNPVERAFLANGILPLSPCDLHRLHPTIFKSPKAAEHALRNYPLNLNMNPIWQAGVVHYRRIGQHGPEARAVIDQGRHPDPRTTAMAMLGPLQSFEGVSCVPEAAKAPQAAEALRPMASLPPIKAWENPLPALWGQDAAPDG